MYVCIMGGIALLEWQLGYGLDSLRLDHKRSKTFSHLHNICISSRAHQVSCSLSTGVLSRDKTTEVKNELSYSSATPVCLRGMDRATLSLPL